MIRRAAIALLSLHATAAFAAPVPWFFVVTAVNVNGDESAPSNVASKLIDDVTGGSTLLTWTRPTAYTDGSPYDDPAGYRIYWGRAAGSYANSTQVNEPLATTASVVFPPAQAQIPPAITATPVLTCSPASKCLTPPVIALTTTSDVGSPALPGSSALANGVYTLKAGGTDIWGTADQFRFTYATLTGDGEIVARVASLSNTDVWTKAGVMIRDSLKPGSPYVLMMVSSMRGVDMQWRAVADQNSQQAVSDMTTRAPRWVRLTRTGNVFRGYHSADGVTWALYSTQTVAIAANALVGLALTSHNVAAMATGTFDGVVVR